MDNKFKVTIDDKEVEFEIIPATVEILAEAQKHYNIAFNNAVASKAILRPRLDDFAREQGLWNEEKEARFTALSKEIRDNQLALKKGGIKLSDARAIALKIRNLRFDLRKLIAVKSGLDVNTAEGQADNARFNFMVSACTVYNDTKKRVFADVADYLNRSGEPIGVAAATKYSYLAYGLDDNFEDELPENQFLKKYKFVDEEGRLVNKEGHFVDEDGRRIDKDGYYLNAEGHRVDVDGNLVDENGEFIVSTEAFLDDQGNPVE